MNRDEWLAARRTGIGGSDIAPVAGLSAFGRTAFEVYLDKIGALPPWAGNDATRWGHLLEPVVASAYAERESATIAPPPERILRHPDYPWCLASLDYVVRSGGSVVKLLECKTTRFPEGWGEEGTDEIPPGYFAQCQWQLLAASAWGVTEVDVPVLIGGQELKVYTVTASQAVQEMLLAIGAEFWRRVETRNPPPIDYRHPEAAKLLNLCYRPHPGKEIDLGDGCVNLVQAWEEAKAQAKAAESVAEECKARLIAACGEAEYGLLSDGRMVHRKLVITPAKEIEAHTRPESQSVRVYIKKARG